MLDEEPIYVISGLRARPMREWGEHLLGPMLLIYLFASQIDDLIAWTYGGLALFLVLYFISKLARGRIALYSDRLCIRSWNDTFLSRTLAVPLLDVRRIAVRGSALRFSYAVEGEPRQVKISLLAPIAEDLHDRILQQLEQLPELRDRIDDRNPHRVVIIPKSD